MDATSSIHNEYDERDSDISASVALLQMTTNTTNHG
jgi:hypothetical protein